MNQYLKSGLHIAKQQMFAIGIMFVFHFFWSLFFYQFIQHRVVAVMSRFPPQEFSNERVHLFLNESVILLIKTELAAHFFWMLLAFLAVTILLTPFITAGVYNSLHTEGPRGTIFIQGMRRLGGAFTLLFWIRLIATAAPCYFLAPHLWQRIMQVDSFFSLAVALLPFILGFIVYSSLLRLITMYIQLAKTTEDGILRSIFVSLRRILPISGLAIIVFAAAASCGLLVFTTSVYWAGFIMLIVHLAYPLIQMMFKVWGIAVQYEFWQDYKG